jgi:hypothetical protein
MPPSGERLPPEIKSIIWHYAGRLAVRDAERFFSSTYYSLWPDEGWDCYDDETVIHHPSMLLVSSTCRLTDFV